MIKTELQFWSLSTTGSKEELIDFYSIPLKNSRQTMSLRQAYIVPGHARDYDVIPSHDDLHLRCPPSAEVATLLSSTELRGSNEFNDFLDGKTLRSLPSRKGSYVASQQTGTPQQGDSLPNGPCGRRDSKNNSLKILSRCPVPITDKERIEYLVQGIRDDQVATSIAVQRPHSLDDFLSIFQRRNSQDSRDARSSRVLLPELPTNCSTIYVPAHHTNDAASLYQPAACRPRVKMKPLLRLQADNLSVIAHNPDIYRTMTCRWKITFQVDLDF
ncbi:hypothetical protein HPB50_008396 [Hyalomma asiaticum]|uniref:Uncharacterized protein n=1 Tax=Hyalomma asiaticum TaxID=266040 RepID=A0ACB7TH35_HYAAI|nr:hypothetical protein HPB50_008396 [Hyalomma asiaticum]